MPNNAPIEKTLIEVTDCCLIVIDVQAVFLAKLPKKRRVGLVRRLVWLVKVATRLGVPLVVTAEDIEVNGSVIPKLAKALPPDTKIHDKMVFGLAADREILGAVRATRRGTAILAGLETDVCVAQSTIGLLAAGYQVVALEDATASPGKAQAYGLARIRAAGALLSNVKSLFYEWLRTVEACREFDRKFERELGDPGVRL